MKTTKRLSRTLIYCGISAALAFAGAQSFASDAQASQAAKPEVSAAAPAAVPSIDRDAVARYPGWNSPQLREVAVRSGRAVIGALRGAQEALEQGDVAGARENLAQASAFSGTIRSLTPYTVVLNRFSNAKQEPLGTTSQIVVDDMLPVFSDVQAVEAFDVEKTAAAGDAKAKSDEQPANAATSEPADASKALAGNEQLEAVGEDIAANTLYLPVGYVSSHIASARNALVQGTPNLDVAKSAVADALDSLVENTVSVHVIPESGLAKYKAAGKAADKAAAKPDSAPATEGQS